jgi:hypothetical protein
MSIKMTANAPPAAVATVATVVEENSTTVIANNVLAPTTPPSNNSAASSNSTTSTSEEEDIIVDVEDEIDIIGHHHHYKLHSSPEHSNHHHSDEGIHSHHRSSSETGSRTTSKCNSEISCSDSANSSDEMKTDKTKESLADKLVAANAEAAKQKQQQQQAEKSNTGQSQQGNGSALAAASLLTAAVKAQAAAAVAALQRNQEEARLDIQDGYKKSKPGGHHAHSNCGPHAHSHSHGHGEKGGCCNNLPVLPGPSKQKVEAEEDLGPIDPNDPGMQKKDDVYKCRFCDRTFCYLCHLRVHERVHTGEKPYKCSFCDVTFSQLGSLTVHMRIHTGEKPYECRICKKKFRHINSLRRHQRQVHRKQPGDEDTEVIASRPASSVFFGNHMGYQNPIFAQQQQEAAAAHSHATSIQQAAAHLQLQQQSLAANQLYLQQQAAAQQAAILRQRQLQQLQLTKQIYAQSALRSISSDGATNTAATTTSSDHPSSNQVGQQLVQQLQQQRSMSLQDTTTRTQVPMTIDQKRQQLLQNANTQALLQLHQAALTGQSSAQLLKRSATKDANTSPVAEKYQKLTTSPVIAGQLAKQQTSPKPTMMAPPSLPVANNTSSQAPSTTQPLTDLVKMIEKGEAPDMNGLTSQERKQMKLKLAKYVMNVLSEDDEESSKLRQDFQKKTTDRRFESTDSAICVNNSEMDCHVDVV